MHTITYKCGTARAYSKTQDLMSFILDHPAYSNLVCQIISSTHTVNGYGDLDLQDLFTAYALEPHSELVNLLNGMFNCANDGELGNRRGSFLEEYIDLIGPMNNSPNTKYREWQVLRGGVPLCHEAKNLDFAYVFGDMSLEAHECKVNVIKRLVSGSKNLIGKLRYMQCLQEELSGRGIPCKMYIPTLHSNIIRANSLLSRFGMQALSRQDLSRVLSDASGPD